MSDERMSAALTKARELEEEASRILREAAEKASALTAEIEALKSAERKEAVAEIVAKMADLGIDPAMIEKAWKKSAAAKKFDSASPKKFPPRFRGPNGEIWSGTGRKPTWLKDLESKGHSAEEFRIPGEK